MSSVKLTTANVNQTVSLKNNSHNNSKFQIFDC